MVIRNHDDFVVININREIGLGLGTIVRFSSEINILVIEYDVKYGDSWNLLCLLHHFNFTEFHKWKMTFAAMTYKWLIMVECRLLKWS